MKIQKELNRIQKELKAPKNQRNDYGSFDYRSAEDILEAYKKIAKDSTITINDTIKYIGERYYIESTATLTLEEESISSVAFAREPEAQKGMNESQITGSASSYARKYALNALFAIDDSKDADFTEDDKKHIELMEKHESAISMIDDIDELKKYYKDNEGDGKEFANMITKRKLKIQKDEKA